MPKLGRPFGIKGNPEYRKALKPAIEDALHEATHLLVQSTTPDGAEIAKSYIKFVEKIDRICKERRMY